MEPDQILACQFSAWYPNFSDVAFRSKIIPLPSSFLEFLLQDGVFLPEGSQAMPRRVTPLPHEEYESWAEEDAGTGGAAPAAVMPEFPELMAEVEAAIGELGGCVAPKLNWSSPHDAVWVSADKSLACRNADEVRTLAVDAPCASHAEQVVLLLKSSDRVAHDVCHAFDACGGAPDQARVQYALALRKWIALKPEREFRCFVCTRELVAVCQRNVLDHAPGLEGQRQDLLEALLEFFEQHVQQRFPLRDYTFDVYLTTAGKVRLIDFNPVFGTTSPLLFDWDELPYEAARPSTAAAPEPVRPHGSEQPGVASQHASPAIAERAAWAGRTSTYDAAHAPAGGGLSSTGGNGGSSKRHDPTDAQGWQEHANGHSRPAGAGLSSGEVLVRFASADSVLRPNTAVYGAPFEMADISQGGAIDELLKRLQVEHREP